FMAAWRCFGAMPIPPFRDEPCHRTGRRASPDRGSRTRESEPASVAELAPCALRTVRAGLGRVVLGEVDAPPLGRVVPAAIALRAPKREHEDVCVEVLFVGHVLPPLPHAVAARSYPGLGRRPLPIRAGISRSGRRDSNSGPPVRLQGLHRSTADCRL